MTSLATQLQRLAVPYTQKLWSSDKQRASLLFEPKEAANLDREAVYAIGISGLEELEDLDPIFTDYAASLFNQTSQNWERTLQTSEVNQQLDETLHRFLLQLSPYFLLKCAHKALEWLIYRYHIHQMNVDDLLRCVFPYHETKLFVRVVQLLPIERETHKWNWIASCGKTGAPLTRSAVISHARSDPAFLAFICDLVPALHAVNKAQASGKSGAAKFRAAIGLWTGTVLGVTETRAGLTERAMAVLIPAAVRALRAPAIADGDHQAAAYMLVAQLVTVATLEGATVASLLPVMTKYVSPRLTREMLMCLALVVKTQRIESLQKRSFKKVCRLPALVPLLASISETYEVSHLLHCLLKRLVPAAVHAADSILSSSGVSDDEFGHTGPPQYGNILNGILTEVTLETNMATHLAKQLMTQLVEIRETGAEEGTWKNAASTFLTLVQKRYPVSFDLAVEALVGSENKEVDAASLQAVLEAAVGGTRGRLVENSTSLLLAMNHAHAPTRVLAVRHLAEALRQESDQQDTGDCQKAALLLERLKDDETAVVEAVLSMDKMLINIIGKEKLGEALLSLLERIYTKPNWGSACSMAINLLCGEEMEGAVSELGVHLLPYLLIPHTTSDVTIPLAVMNSHAAKTSSVVRSFSKSWLKLASGTMDEETVAAMNAHVCTGPAAALLASSTANRKGLIKELMSTAASTRRAGLLLTCILSEALRKTKDWKVALEVAEHLLQVIDSKRWEFSTFSSTTDSFKDHFTEWLRVTEGTGVVALGALWWALSAVVGFFNFFNSKLPEAAWWTQDDQLVCLLVKTLNQLVWVSSCEAKQNALIPFHNLVKQITQEVLDPSALCRLAGLVWSSHLNAPVPPGGISALLQAAMSSLLARAWLQEGQGAKLVALLESTLSPALPGLLMCLGSGEEVLRQGAIACVEVARRVTEKKLGPYNKLFRKVSKQQQEVIADANHLQNILLKTLREDETLRDLVLHWVIDSQTPPPVRKHLLFHLQIIPNECILQPLLAIGEEILELCQQEQPSELTAVHMEMLALLMARIDAKDAASLTLKSAQWQFLNRALHTSQGYRDRQLPPTLVMHQVTKEFFQALPSVKEQRCVVSAILDVGETAVSTDMASQARRILQQVRLNWEHVCHELAAEKQSSASSTVKNRRRSRLAKTSPFSWKRITFLLETLQPRKSMQDPEPCVSALFHLLRKIQEMEGEEWEYRQRLLLDIVQNLTTRWQHLEITPDEESVDIESLVKVVRSSHAHNATKQHALAVMANLAFYFPELLLHHVMSIFTFVGTGLLAADDEHSLQLVGRTITVIVPALLAARTNTDRAADQLVNQIVQVFVDAQRAIPRHRSLAVFSTLVSTLQPNTALWRVLVLLVATATQHRDGAEHGQDVDMEAVGGSLERDLEFGIHVCDQFSAEHRVGAATQLVRFLQWLVEHHQAKPATPGHKKTPKRCKGEMSTIIDVSIYSAHQLKLLQFHITRLVTRILSTETLITQVVRKEDVSEAAFRQFVQEAVIYMLAVAKTHSLLAATPQGKFWKAIMGKAYDVIDKVLYLLPTDVLLSVVTDLLRHDLLAVRRKALELLASKLQALQETAGHEAQSLLSTVDTLLAVAVDTDAPKDADSIATRQMALFNLKLLCKILGETNQKRFVQVMTSVMAKVHTSEAPPVVGSVLLLEAEVVSVVRAHAIPHLSHVVTPLLDLLSNKDYTGKHDLVLTCGLTALHRLVTTLPHFLSPYLQRILAVISQLSSTMGSVDTKSQAALRLAAIRHQIATVIASRVLVPALSETFIEIMMSPAVSKDALKAVLVIGHDHVSHVGREDLMMQQTPLLTFFMASLDLRHANSKMCEEDVDSVEEAAIEALLAMVVRLSEASFRPMFYKLYDWACREDSPDRRLRKLTFFRLADRLADKLRSLFNLFVGHTLQAACSMLSSNNTVNGEITYFGEDTEALRHSCSLIGYVLDCLAKCMAHDTEGLFTGDVFNMLLEPLVSQVENMAGTEVDYERRVAKHVVPCLSHFMVAAREDAHQKAFNYQVLLKARHISSKVRLASLRVISGVATQMRDDYVVLLPETIPFLAELMEDECEEVERECQQVIANLEEVVGESLQKYF